MIPILTNGTLNIIKGIIFLEKFGFKKIEIIKPKKKKGYKMSNKLQKLLLSKEVSNDAEYTHTSLFSDTPAGKYFFESRELDNLFKVYYEQVFIKRKDCFLTEKHPKDYSKIIIDLDFRYKDRTERAYTLSVIKDIIVNYQDGIRDVTGDLTQEQSEAYVLEKDLPFYDEQKQMLKDGVHIIFPNVFLSYKAQHWIRRKVVEKMKHNAEFALCCNSVEDIIDECVVQRNNFIMYGSKKNPSSQAYKLTHIYDLNLDEMEIPENSSELLKKLSLLVRSRETPSMIDEILKNETAMKESASVAQVAQDIVVNGVIRVKKTKSKEYLRALLSLLAPKRVEDYNEWLRIGAILYNCGEDNQDIFKEWSEKSPKYSESHCDRLWSRTYPNFPESRRAHVGSLQMMASKDSPANYFTVIKNYQSEDDLNEYVLNALNRTDYEMAQLVFFTLKDKYKYSRSNWYMFDNNRWKLLASSSGKSDTTPFLHDMVIKVSNILLSYHTMLNLEIQRVQTETGIPLDKDSYLHKQIEKCIGAERMFKSNTSKNTICSECKMLFRDDDFFKQLDMNIYLLGFDNGVYDLKTGSFRSMDPGDKISYSTGYDYTPDVVPSIREEILDLFQKSIPDQGVRNFLLTFLGSTCIGRNKNELFVNLEGVGGNGKGVITKLHNYALGDYAGTLDNSYLTNITNSQEGHNSKLISVFKKRYVQVNEPPAGKFLAQDYIKELTGNDDMQVRKAHAADPEISDAVMFKLVMLCNKMPKIQNPQDEGFLRRYKGVNFPNLFVANPNPKKTNEYAQNPNLKTQLANDVRYRQQYMIILLEYVAKYIQDGEKIEIPPLVEANTRQIMNSQNPYSEFIDEKLDVTGDINDVVLCNDLIDEYKDYYRENISGGVLPKISQNDFNNEMKKAFRTYPVEFHLKYVSPDLKKKGKGFSGIKLKDD